MDLDTMLRRIKRQFGDEYDVVINDDDIYGWIYEAELDIIRNAPDSCIFHQNIPNPDGSDFPLPIPVVVTVQRVVWGSKAIKFITAEQFDALGISLQSTSNAAAPEFWYVGPQNIGFSSGSSGMPGRSLFILPEPPYSKTGSVQISYTKVPDLLDGTTGSDTLTVPEAFHTDVITFCLARAHNKNQNAQSEKMQMDLYDKSLNIRRNEANTVDQNTYKDVDPLDVEAGWSY